MKKYFLLAIFLSFSVFSFAQEKAGRVIIPESNLKFTANDDFTELTITGFESNKKFEGKVIEIPAKIQGVSVTAIGESAFASTGYYISGIWIPDSVKKIGAGAFTWSRFDSIRLPSGLEVIEQDTFEGCRAKTINIPSSVKVIMAGAFSGSYVESVVIPKNCAIGKRNEDDNSYFHSGSAFRGSEIKTLTFSGGRVYFYENSFGDEDYKKFRNFSSCDNLEKIVIPKDFDPLYVADNTSKEYTLADFFAGEKISSSLALQKQLKSVKVRNSHKVESAEQSIEYDKAFKAGDWDKAIQIAEKFNDSEWNAKFDNAYVKKYESLFSKGDYAAAIQCTKDRYSKHLSWRDDFDSASWRERFLAANEKPVLDSYNKELSAKNFEKAKKTAKEFLEKIDEGPEDGFNGLDLYWLKEKWQGLLRDVDYAIYLPAFMDSLLKQEGSILKDGKDVVFMLPLPDGAFKYAGYSGEDKFVLKDSGDEEITIGRKDFLARFNEKTGKSFSVTSEKGKNYLCREATAEEKSAYEKKLEAEQAALLQAKLEAEKKQAEEAAALLKKKKDIFKSYMDSALKNAKIEKNGDDYRIKFSLSGEPYDMADRVFSFKDSEGKSIKITEDEFHQFVKEIYNTHYEIARGGSYLYRKATTEEKNSAVQKEKDFFKAYMDSALKNSKIEKNGSGYRITVPLPNASYNSLYKIFTFKDSDEKSRELSKDEFNKFVKEIYNTRYEIVFDGSYVYRDATAEEASAFAEQEKQTKYLDAFKNGKLHTNVSAVEFAEKKGVVKISKFTEKNSAFEKSGLKKNDVVKKIVLVDGSGSESDVKWNELAKIPAGATLSFTVERGNGKKAQSLTISVLVEWNENELKNIR